MVRPIQLLAFLSLLIGSAVPVAAQAQPDPTIRRITASASYRNAAAALDAGHEKWVENVVALTEIPAPPFKEAERAKRFAQMLRERGLSDVEIDEEGNVLGLRRGSADADLIVVSAHLDTVFPEGTDVKVRREGDRLLAPGIGDDSAGLATILSLVEALDAGKVRTRSSILFVGTVGEEGLGNLRGVRHLFAKSRYKDRVKAFFSIDGTGLDEMTTKGVGSKRYRISFNGPGGHSYEAFGIVNPMAALARTVVDFYRIEPPANPKTTYSASVVGGGTSVNAIPQKVWLEVDMRSEGAAELAALERQFLSLVDEAVAGENAARSTGAGAITAEPELIGDRPAGATAQDADIVRYTRSAFAREGIAVSQVPSSTDSNVPMGLGIPAVTVSGNATGGRAHAPDEWIGTEKAKNVRLKRILLAAIVATAGMR
jgi:acetylornithine deacetylase/succinyl-diaminopimelate desuccinylase-like protein